MALRMPIVDELASMWPHKGCSLALVKGHGIKLKVDDKVHVHLMRPIKQAIRVASAPQTPFIKAVTQLCVVQQCGELAWCSKPRSVL